METQNKTKKLGFYKVDNNPNGWKSIGVEGRLIEEMTNNEVGGIIMDYSYIPGNDEFHLSLDYNEVDFKGAEKVKAWYIISIRGDTARITKDIGMQERSEHVASIEIPWGETRQHYNTEKRLQRYKEYGFKERDNSGMYFTKKLTPRNAISAVLNNLEALGKEQIAKVERKIQSDKVMKEWEEERKVKEIENARLTKEWEKRRE